MSKTNSDSQETNLQRTHELAKAFMSGASVRATASTLAIQYSLKLYQLGRQVLDEELEKHFKNKDERQEVGDFLKEANIHQGNQPYNLQELVDKLATALKFVKAELDEDYGQYKEFKNYKPPIPVEYRDHSGKVKVTAVERSSSVVFVDKADALTDSFDSIAACLMCRPENYNIIRLVASNDVAQTLPKKSEKLRMIRRPLATWAAKGSTAGLLSNLLEPMVQRMARNTLDVLIVDRLDLLCPKDMEVAHEKILKAVFSRNMLQRPVQSYGCILLAGVPMSLDLAAPSDSDGSLTCVQMIEQNFENETIIYGSDS